MKHIAPIVGWIFILFFALGAIGLTDVKFIVGKENVAKQECAK